MARRAVLLWNGLGVILTTAVLVAQQPAPVPPAPPPIQPDQARPAHVLGGLDGPGLALAYGESQGTLVAACENRALHYWLKPEISGIRSGDSTPHVLAGHEAPITALAWRGGPILASAGADRKILLWSMPAGTVKATLQGHTGLIRALAMSSDGKTLASAGDDHAIHVWDVEGGKLLRKLEGHTDWVMALAFSSDGKQLASGGYDQMIRIWDWATPAAGAKVREFPSKPAMPADLTNHVLCLAFSPDGKQLAAGGTDMAIRRFTVADGKEAGAMTGHTSTVTALAYHPAGAVLISGSKDRTVRVWNLANGQAFKVLEGHQAWVQGLVLVEQGQLAASVGADATVRFWDLRKPPM